MAATTAKLAVVVRIGFTETRYPKVRLGTVKLGFGVSLQGGWTTPHLQRDSNSVEAAAAEL